MPNGRAWGWFGAWALHRGDRPCPESGMLSGTPGQVSVECGGVDPAPWLVAAVVLIAIGALAFVGVRLRDRRSALG